LGIHRTQLPINPANEIVVGDVPHEQEQLFGGNLIVNPDGEIIAEAKTEDHELIVADCDLDATKFGKKTISDFKRHRRIEHCGRITSQTGAILPPEAVRLVKPDGGASTDLAGPHILQEPLQGGPVGVAPQICVSRWLPMATGGRLL
jgi:hypothetical protein